MEWKWQVIREPKLNETITFSISNKNMTEWNRNWFYLINKGTLNPGKRFIEKSTCYDTGICTFLTPLYLSIQYKWKQCNLKVAFIAQNNGAPSMASNKDVQSKRRRNKGQRSGSDRVFIYQRTHFKSLPRAMAREASDEIARRDFCWKSRKPFDEPWALPAPVSNMHGYKPRCKQPLERKKNAKDFLYVSS